MCMRTRHNSGMCVLFTYIPSGIHYDLYKLSHSPVDACIICTLYVDSYVI